jgi:5-hydroxyisourate hydrolase
MARLSTHVLDTAHGVPAAGLRIDLHRIDANGRRTHVTTATTNADGRTSEPLMSGETMPTGVYELTFHAGRYLRDRGIDIGEPAFLDEIVIRFGIDSATGAYHVPLLLSPYGYSTYRGS